MRTPDDKSRIFSSSFFALFAINLFVMTGYYLLFIVMGPFAAERFGAPPNMAGLAAGLMILGCLAGRFVTGGSLERMGYRKVLHIGLGLYIGSMALYHVAGSMTLLLAIRFIGGVGVGCIGTVTGTVIAGVLPPRQRGLGISYFSLSAAIALATGPVLAIYLMQAASYSTIFLICLALGAVSCPIALFLRATPAAEPEEKSRPAESGAPENGQPGRFRLADYIEYRVVPLGVVVMLVSFCYATVQSFLSFYARELNLVAAAGMFFLVYAVVVLLTRPLAGKIFDRQGENIIIYPALLLIAGGLLQLSLTASAWDMLLSSALLGAGFGNFQSLSQAASLKVVPLHRFGQATSTYFILLDLGIGLGPYLLGFLVPSAGYSGLYLATACVVFACLPLYFLLHGRKARHRAAGGKTVK